MRTAEGDILGINESEYRTNMIVSGKIRWLAVVTGCFTAVAGSFGFGLYFSIVPTFLIVGAIAQPRSPRSGRWLMWVGALFLSLWVLPVGISALLSYRLVGRLDVIALSLVSVLLVSSCDFALLIDAVRMRRAGGTL